MWQKPKGTWWVELFVRELQRVIGCALVAVAFLDCAWELGGLDFAFLSIGVDTSQN